MRAKSVLPKGGVKLVMHMAVGGSPVNNLFNLIRAEIFIIK